MQHPSSPSMKANIYGSINIQYINKIKFCQLICKLASNLKFIQHDKAIKQKTDIRK